MRGDKSSYKQRKRENKERYFNIRGDTYRLFHGLVHIGPGIISRIPYQPKAIAWIYMGRGMIPGPIWKMSCSNLFITYLTMTEIN
jgi:hypothetical protein